MVGGLAARRLRKQVKAAARDDLPVWVAGPPGGDAAQVARAIHRQSPRGGQALEVLDCAAVPAPLLGRALLGCAGGASPLGARPHHKLRIAPLGQRRPDIALLAAEALLLAAPAPPAWPAKTARISTKSSAEAA